jgi:hypothetical protein
MYGAIFRGDFLGDPNQNFEEKNPDLEDFTNIMLKRI